MTARLARRGFIAVAGTAVAACGTTDPRAAAKRARDREVVGRTLSLQRCATRFYRVALQGDRLSSGTRRTAESFLGHAVIGARELARSGRRIGARVGPALPDVRPRRSSAFIPIAGRVEAVLAAALAAQVSLLADDRARQQVLGLEASAGTRAAAWALMSETQHSAVDQGSPGLGPGAILAPVDFYSARRRLRELSEEANG